MEFISKQLKKKIFKLSSAWYFKFHLLKYYSAIKKLLTWVWNSLNIYKNLQKYYINNNELWYTRKVKN